MKKSILVILAIFAGSIFGVAEAAIATDKSTAVLRWVDKSGRTLFTTRDIIRFDWDKQIFELTRFAAMDLLANLKGLGQKFTVVDNTAVIYQGTFVSLAASMPFHGPIIMKPFPDEKSIQPPLFQIQDGYHSPSKEPEPDLRFSERLKKALEQANVLGEININNPPTPIEKDSHGWFGKKSGMRVWVDVFPNSVLLNAFEQGRSLVVAKILSVRSTREKEPGKFYYYKAKVIRPIIIGDLIESDIKEPIELFAGSSFGDALTPCSTYALFISKGAPYHFSWGFRNDVVKLDGFSDENLQALVEAATEVYKKTSICKFRESKFKKVLSLPKLPEGILAICEQFRTNPQSRVVVAKKIYKSDMGSRQDISEPFSSIMKYLPPKINLSREEIVYLLGEPSLKCGWTYKWFCGPDKNNLEHIGILSITFDKHEKATRVLYNPYDKTNWVKPDVQVEGAGKKVNQENRLSGELVEEAKVVMAKFQQALKDSEWNKALSLCSEAVRSEAKKYISAEIFFKDVVPIKQIISVPDVQTSGGQFGPDKKRLAYFCFLRLSEPDAKPTINWGWRLNKTDSGWVVDFKNIPLGSWIEQERLRLNREDEKAKEKIRTLQEGLKLSLVPLSDGFVIGQAMLFRIEMKNISNETLGPIDTMSAMVNDPMLVKDSNGTIVPYIDTSYQTGIGKDFLEPGETIVLADNYDVRSQYHIVTLGKYTFQFKGLHQTKPSNMVEIYIMPGELSSLESVVEKLVPILPEGWILTRHLSDGIWVHLIGKPRRKGKDRGIGLFIYVNPDKSNLRGEFLGQTKWGPLYIQSLNAELLWPDYKKQITKALVISTAKAGIINPVVRAKEVRPAKDIETIVAGNSDFAFELYQQLRETKGNLFFSPYSISTALALTYAGARNDTEKQMAEALHFDLRQEMFHCAFGKLQTQLNKQGKKGDYQLSVANALWLQKDYGLLQDFVDLNKTHYDAGLNRVNFKTQTEKARKTINEWVEKKTNQKIKNLIPAGTLDALTRLVLTNAVYFKGDWASQFEPEDTQEADFYVSSAKKVKADLMYKKADFKYAETNDFQILELPYKGEDLSMVVLLPKKNYDITTLEDSLTTENLSKWLKILRSREVIVHLPKFKLTSRFELAGVLGKMGMPDAFSPRADFSGMTGNKDLFISAVLHKAFVDVNEEGTEAAAATGVVMKLTAMPTPPPVFRADHPFVFMIKDNASNSILFIGRLTNPAEKAE